MKNTSQEDIARIMSGDLSSLDLVTDPDSSSPPLQRDSRVIPEVLLHPSYGNQLEIPVGVNLPIPAYQFFPDDGNRFEYRKRIFIDLRWGHLEWQKHSFSRDKYTHNMKRFIVQKAPRRHGKTWALIHNMAGGLVAMSEYKINPVGAYYCPDKGQALKNAWKAIAHATRNIPNVKLNERMGIVTWPSPTLRDPKSITTIYVFGVRGGSGVKRGTYYDWCILDEVEFLSHSFIEEVGMGSTFDRQGHLALTGTPYNLGVLDEWLDKATGNLQLQHDIEQGLLRPDDPSVPADYDDWFAFSGDCWNLGVYPREQLLKLKASMSHRRFAQEMECKNPSDIVVFYFRNNYEIALKEKRISPLIKPDPRLPVRFYYDFGIGRKSDRCAWSAWQFTNSFPICLYSGEIIGKSYSGIVADIRKTTPFSQSIYEHVLPHDTGAREQSDLTDKRTKFQTELKEQGVSGWEKVSVLKRHKNPELVNGIVNDTIHLVRINSLHADTVVQALKHHRRKYDKNTELVVEEESKTKYRDSAHMFRYAMMDWKNEDYMKRFPSRQELKFADAVAPFLTVGKGGHPVGKSIIIDKDNDHHTFPLTTHSRLDGADGESAIDAGDFF